MVDRASDLFLLASAGATFAQPDEQECGTNGTT
jgi:hypothetical protein